LTLHGLGATGALLVVVGLGMAAMPFIGALVGLPFDGSAAWSLTQDRLVLHLLPGIVGAVTGLMLVRAQRQRVRDRLAYPGWLPVVVVGAIVVGLWNGTGPWLLELVLPAAQPSALMFHGIPHFRGFSAAHQIVLEAVCHWIPGLLSLGAAWASYRFLRALPPAVSPTGEVSGVRGESLA
jgi:hypothetical protein